MRLRRGLIGVLLLLGVGISVHVAADNPPPISQDNTAGRTAQGPGLLYDVPRPPDNTAGRTAQGTGLLYDVSRPPISQDNAADRAAAVAALNEFNREMRALYANGRSVLLDATRPIILVDSDIITLITDNQTYTETYTPPVYHHLKSVAHVILGLFGALLPAVEGVDTSNWQSGLLAIDRQINRLKPHLRFVFTPEQNAKQQRLLDLSSALIADLMRTNLLDRNNLIKQLTPIKLMWLASVDEAGKAQLDRLHAIVSAWRAQLSPEQWEKLYVVVLGPRTPRVNNLQAAYFARLLGQDELEDRVIYAENIFDMEQAMRLLGILIIDRKLSELTFEDKMRMDRDLLGNFAASYLDQLLPDPR